MRRIAAHRHGRPVLPLNFFRDVDFSVLHTMEHFEEIVGHDFFKAHELANLPPQVRSNEEGARDDELKRVLAAYAIGGQDPAAAGRQVDEDQRR